MNTFRWTALYSAVLFLYLHVYVSEYYKSLKERCLINIVEVFDSILNGPNVVLSTVGWGFNIGTFCITITVLDIRVGVRVPLRLTVSQYYLGVEPTLWTFDQILLLFQEFGSGICCPVSVAHPL
jgi:hypothetical protein